MNKNILIISTSLRKDGNSESLAHEFAKGAKEAGNNVEEISLVNKRIGYCIGCLACQKTGNCVINDDMNTIVDKMLTADVIAFATPVYFYEMCGQMKTLLDRTNPLFTKNYKFSDIYLLASAAEDDMSAFEGTQNGLQGWIDCYEKAKLAGCVFAGGVTGVKDIQGHTTLAKAYAMGQAV